MPLEIKEIAFAGGVLLLIVVVGLIVYQMSRPAPKTLAERIEEKVQYGTPI